MQNRELGILFAMGLVLLTISTLVFVPVFFVSPDAKQTSYLDRKLEQVVSKSLNDYHDLRMGQPLQEVSQVLDCDSIDYVGRKGEPENLTVIYQYDIRRVLTGKRSQGNSPFMELHFRDEKLCKKRFHRSTSSSKLKEQICDSTEHRKEKLPYGGIDGSVVTQSSGRGYSGFTDIKVDNDGTVRFDEPIEDPLGW